MQSLKNLLRPFKRDIYRYRRSVYEFLGNPKYSRPGLDHLDIKLEKYLDYTGGFFIEVGANNGYSQSNTYFLERFRGWRGVLIEAVPELYQQCKKERTNSYVFNYALVSHEYREAYIDIHYAGLMSVVEGAFDNLEARLQHVASGLKVQSIGNSYQTRVSTITLETLLDSLQPPLIDFFSLDVEGYEVEVLEGLNLKKYKPKYMLVETNNFEAISNMLEAQYDLVECLTRNDCLFKFRDMS